MFEKGWKWKVLGWQFAVEVPDGPETAQAVLTDKTSVAMLPSYWNMALVMASFNANEMRLGRAVLRDRAGEGQVGGVRQRGLQERYSGDL